MTAMLVLWFTMLLLLTALPGHVSARDAMGGDSHLRLKWNVSLAGDVVMKPVLSSDGQDFFVATQDGYAVQRIDGATGVVRWTTNLSLDLSSTSLGEVDGILACEQDQTGNCFLVSSRTGSVVGTCGSSRFSAFTIALPSHGCFLSIASTGGTSAFNSKGSVLWQAASPSNPTGWAIDHGLGHVFVAFEEQGMLVLSLENGDLIWSYNATTMFQPAALWFVAPSYLFATGAAAFGTSWVVFDTRSQTALWNSSLIAFWENTAVLDAVRSPSTQGSLIFAASNQGLNASLLSIRLKDGAVLWQTPLNASQTAAAAVTSANGDGIYIVAANAMQSSFHVRTFDAATGAQQGALALTLPPGWNYLYPTAAVASRSPSPCSAMGFGTFLYCLTAAT